MLVWETHVAYQHPKAAKLGSPISSTVTTYFCTMSLKCLSTRGHLSWAPTCPSHFAPDFCLMEHLLAPTFFGSTLVS